MDILPKTVLLFLPFSSFNCLQTLSFPHPYIHGLALFMSTVCTLGKKSFKACVYSTVCRKKDYSVSSQEPLKTWVGTHPAGLSLLSSMLRSPAYHMHTKPVYSTLPGCAIQPGTLQHKSSKPRDAENHYTYCRCATRSFMHLCKTPTTSLLDCCCCMLAAMHLDNSGGSG